MMDIPDWIVDEILAGAKPTAFRLTVLLLRHGRPVADHDGNRRIYWRGSLQSLARLTGVSKRSLLDAERELVESGFLVVHNKTERNSQHSISVPLMRQQDRDERGRVGEANFAAPSEPEFRTHDDDVITGQELTSSDHIITTSEGAKSEPILSRLAAHGVTDPRSWIAMYGPHQCVAACDDLDRLLDDEYERDLHSHRISGYETEAAWRSTQIRNPAGLLRSMLTSRSAFRPSPYETARQ